MVSGSLKPVETAASAAADGNDVFALGFGQFAVATLAAQLAVNRFGVNHGAESLQKLVESARL